jgi:large subunit ribosomal protein L24
MEKKPLSDNVKLDIRKNDTVKIIAGNYKGKKGKVLKAFPRENRVVVEGVNFVKRHTRKQMRGGSAQGGIQEREAPINVSDVMIICPKCGSATRVGKFIAEDKSRSRLCKKCSERIDS